MRIAGNNSGIAADASTCSAPSTAGCATSVRSRLQSRSGPSVCTNTCVWPEATWVVATAMAEISPRRMCAPMRENGIASRTRRSILPRIEEAADAGPVHDAAAADEGRQRAEHVGAQHAFDAQAAPQVEEARHADAGLVREGAEHGDAEGADRRAAQDVGARRDAELATDVARHVVDDAGLVGAERGAARQHQSDSRRRRRHRRREEQDHGQRRRAATRPLACPRAQKLRRRDDCTAAFSPRPSLSVRSPARAARRPLAAALQALTLAGGVAMKLTLSVIKADVGSIGGHTRPSTRMLESVRAKIGGAIERKLLFDGMVTHTGDDIAMIMIARARSRRLRDPQVRLGRLPRRHQGGEERRAVRRGAGPPGRRAVGQHPRRRPRGRRDRDGARPGAQAPPGRGLPRLRRRQVRPRRLQPAALHRLLRPDAQRRAPAQPEAAPGLHLHHHRHGPQERRPHHRARRARARLGRRRALAEPRSLRRRVDPLALQARRADRLGLGHAPAQHRRHLHRQGRSRRHRAHAGHLPRAGGGGRAVPARPLRQRRLPRLARHADHAGGDQHRRRRRLLPAAGLVHRLLDGRRRPLLARVRRSLRQRRLGRHAPEGRGQGRRVAAQGFIGPTMASHAELAYTGMVEALAALDRSFTIRSE